MDERNLSRLRSQLWKVKLSDGVWTGAAVSFSSTDHWSLPADQQVRGDIRILIGSQADRAECQNINALVDSIHSIYSLWFYYLLGIYIFGNWHLCSERLLRH